MKGKERETIISLRCSFCTWHRYWWRPSSGNAKWALNEFSRIRRYDAIVIDHRIVESKSHDECTSQKRFHFSMRSLFLFAEMGKNPSYLRYLRRMTRHFHFRSRPTHATAHARTRFSATTPCTIWIVPKRKTQLFGFSVRFVHAVMRSAHICRRQRRPSALTKCIITLAPAFFVDESDETDDHVFWPLCTAFNFGANSKAKID